MLSFYRHMRSFLATRLLDVHEQGEEVIGLDRDALKVFMALRHCLKGEADDRSVNTQLGGRVFHSADIARRDELDIMIIV
jgi:hypothetical protein